MQKKPRAKNKNHLKWISNLPCIICLRNDIQAAHIRSGNGAGIGIKSPDDCVVPLCCSHHKKQHGMNEGAFWNEYGGIENATRLANELYDVSGNNMKAFKLIVSWRRIW